MNFATLVSLATVLVGAANAKKIFMDNDGLAPLHLLFPIAAGDEVVGLSGSFGSSSLVDSVGQGWSIIETYNLSSCVPHYAGAAQPLLRTNETFQAWENLFGHLQWEGAWSPSYEDTYTWSNFTYDPTPGAIALINAVKQYKDTDPVTIYSAGTMTTVAQALSIYPDLAKEAAGLYIMGGYFDNQYAQATGDSNQIDINTDINLIQDPEAAQIVFTADWSEFYIGGNVTNFLVPSQELFDRVIDRAGGLDVIRDNSYFSQVSAWLGTANFTENTFEQNLPFWDDVVSAFMSFPDLIKETIDVQVSVDTSYYSPFYGSLRIYNPEYAPKGGYKLGNATIVTAIDDAKFYDMVVDLFISNWTQFCEVGTTVPLTIWF